MPARLTMVRRAPVGGPGPTATSGAGRPTVLHRAAPPTSSSRPTVIGALPRPSQLAPASEPPVDAGPQRPRRPWPLPRRQREVEAFRAPRWRIAWRLACWAYAAAHYGLHRVWDRLHGRSGGVARGVRLRQTFEHMGGTFLKLGEQLATRIDLLPFDTCRELSKILDDMPAIPLREAVAAIERTTGRPLAQTFARLDPQPLGSMSVACFYHGLLVGGEEVAVKVRRPGIGERFAADLAALGVLCGVAEWLTLLRLGFTRALRAEMGTMLMEELDFRAEARFTELFGRQAKRDGQPLSAPRVFDELSGKDVLVRAYQRGLWLQDLIGAQERHDEPTLRYLATLGITPQRVAKRLQRAFYWSTFETLFYHADPHPANILVLPDSRLVFANFGACGPTTRKSRRNFAELFHRQARRDLDGMVQVIGNILSPIPQTDLYALTKVAEAKVARWQYGFDSRHAEWWERSSAGLWIGILEMARELRIPVNIETARFFRAALLYDTVTTRLHPRINGPREFEKYQREARRRAGRRILRRQREELTAGNLLVELDRVADLGRRLVYRLQDFSDRPTTSFLATINKGAFALSTLLRSAVGAGLITVAAMVVAIAAGGGAHDPVSLPAAARGVALSPWYWAAVGVVILRAYRLVQYRLGDMDRQS